jgi:hypothetical protein
MRTVISSPSAAILIESMRDIGYSLESAIADIIDNSITANASRIQVLTDTDGQSGCMAFVDDGIGMDQTELIEAMRLGSQNPLTIRNSKDLGRFGLGLKTASFSQARRLTVISRRNGETHGARWDLDHVARTNEWDLLLLDSFEDVPWIEELQEEGTIVLWELLDRVIEKTSVTDNHSYFASRLRAVSDHLSLVFHRFIAGEPGTNKIVLRVNGTTLKALDPFASHHKATQITAPEHIQYNGRIVTLQGYTLPHHSKAGVAIWNTLAGKDGYLRSQGFYVYRERRLIIWGTWFGLAPKSEVTKLCRVKVDLGNDIDADWKIDVRKSHAQPPFQVRARMKSLIERLREPSERVFRGGSVRVFSDERVPTWVPIQEDGNIRWEVNGDHPLIRELAEALPAESQRLFRHVTQILAAALPVNQIFHQMSSQPEHLTTGHVDKETLLHAVVSTRNLLATSGLDDTQILSILQSEEPFKSNLGDVRTILKSFGNVGRST